MGMMSKLMRRKSKEQKLKDEYNAYYKKKRMELGRNMPTYAQWKKERGEVKTVRTETTEKGLRAAGIDEDKIRKLRGK